MTPDDGRFIAGLKVENWRQGWPQPAPPPTFSDGSDSSSGNGATLILILLVIGFTFGPLAAVGVFVGLLFLYLALRLLGEIFEFSFWLIGAIFKAVFSLPGLLCIGLIIVGLYYIGSEHPAWLEKRQVAKPVVHESYVERMLESMRKEQPTPPDSLANPPDLPQPSSSDGTTPSDPPVNTLDLPPPPSGDEATPL